MSSKTTNKTKPFVAVVGCGHWGKHLVRNFSGLGALAAICDHDEGIVSGLSDTFDVPARQWPELLADKAVGAVVLATPAEAHAPMAREALLAGKHVYVEKPIALDPSDAQDLVDLAEETVQILMVGHLLQYHPAFLKLMDIVKSGEIGRLQYIYSTRVNFGKIRREEDILWSFAPHDISMILALVGEEPEFVSAVGSNFLHSHICDTTITHLKFPGGQSGHIFVSWLHPFKEQRLVVIGDKGMLVFDDTLPWDTKLMRYDHEIQWINQVPQPIKAVGQPVKLHADEPLRLECEHFLNCIRTGETPRTDGAEGLRVLRVLESASRDLGASLGGPESRNEAGIHLTA